MPDWIVWNGTVFYMLIRTISTFNCVNKDYKQVKLVPVVEGDQKAQRLYLY